MRLFERLPRNTAAQAGIPEAAFTAPTSALVFDHLTRRVALLHDGPDAERAALRTEVIRLLRGAIPSNGGTVKTSAAVGSMTEKQFAERVEACKEHIAAGEVIEWPQRIRKARNNVIRANG